MAKTRFSTKLVNILGLSFYRYELTSSNYNPNIDSNITITCKVTDIFGNPIKDKPLTLYKNGTSVSNATTDSNGVATWTNQQTSWGTQDYNIGNTHMQVNVGGWRMVWSNSSTTPTVRAYRSGDRAKLLFNGYSRYCTQNTWADTTEAYLSNIAPSYRVVSISNNPTEIISVTGTGYISVMTNGATGTKSIYGQLEWTIA